MKILNLLCLFSLLFLFSCKPSTDLAIDAPTIVTGTARVTGSITGPDGTIKDSSFVNIGVVLPISGEFVQYKTLIDPSGKFSVDVNVETDVSLMGFYTSLNFEKSLYIKLKSGGVTNIDIAYNSANDIEKIEVTPSDMTQYDMTRSLKIIGEMIEYRRAPQRLFDKSANDFLSHAKAGLSERLKILNNDDKISKELKVFLAKDFGLFMYSGSVFEYEKAMRLNYRNTSGDKTGNPQVRKIDRSYFRFLRDFKLNDPQYLICYSFTEFQQKILRDEIIGLPEIGENDIPSWLARVKVTLSDLVGFSDGPYYDILAANAYGRQLNEEIRPLSEKQKENINAYWKTGEIAKILLRKNQQVVELDKSRSPVVVNDVSSVPDDKVMETIVAKHKDKVVFIDLWATWCGPCLEAMKEFRTAKADFHDKGVAFVYLTNGSSPRKLWEEKIKGIGSEHYYLKDSQWEYIMNHFELEYIPSYLLYNKEGVLVNKFSAFPGNDKVKKMITATLK
jgi:thiol-disulfide isomerase/thioredoxin